MSVFVFVGVPVDFPPPADRLPPRFGGAVFCALLGSGRAVGPAAGEENASAVRRGGANVGLTIVGVCVCQLTLSLPIRVIEPQVK